VRRSQEGAAKRGGDAGLRRTDVDLNDSAIEDVEIRRGMRISFHLHYPENDRQPTEVSWESRVKP